MVFPALHAENLDPEALKEVEVIQGEPVPERVKLPLRPPDAVLRPGLCEGNPREATQGFLPPQHQFGPTMVTRA